jgi:transposase
VICDYCRLFEPAAWSPPSAALRQLRDLVRTREALNVSRVECRRASGQDTAAADAAMAAVISRLEAEIAALDQVIEDAIGQDKDLQTRHDLLISVPGIGTHTAAVILCELPGCCARRGKRQLMPVSIRAIGSPARRSMRRRGSPGSATPPCARPSTSRLSPRSAGTRWSCASA